MLVEHRGKRPTVHALVDGLMARVTPRQTAWLGAHRDDRVF